MLMVRGHLLPKPGGSILMITVGFTETVSICHCQLCLFQNCHWCPNLTKFSSMASVVVPSTKSSTLSSSLSDVIICCNVVKFPNSLTQDGWRTWLVVMLRVSGWWWHWEEELSSCPDNLSDAMSCTYIVSRCAKCHGYDGYIRAKILTSWGQSLGGHTILQIEAFFGGDLHNLCKISLSKLS